MTESLPQGMRKVCKMHKPGWNHSPHTWRNPCVTDCAALKMSWLGEGNELVSPDCLHSPGKHSTLLHHAIQRTQALKVKCISCHTVSVQRSASTAQLQTHLAAAQNTYKICIHISPGFLQLHELSRGTQAPPPMCKALPQATGGGIRRN